MAENWYLIHTNPQREAIVADQLQRYDVELFLPSITIDRGYGRGTRKEPLFPHYLFVKADLMAAGVPVLNHLPGVRTLVQFDQVPIVVPEAVIDQLRLRLQARKRQITLADHLYKPGQTVRVQSGPFSGLNAVFQKGLKGTERAQVLLDVLGKLTRVQLDVACLETT